MAIQVSCDGCGSTIHKEGETKYRADLSETGLGKRGFDLCAKCFNKIAGVVPKYRAKK